jgi:predicted  nucleic acid-binding Zn-ribbon protein
MAPFLPAIASIVTGVKQELVQYIDSKFMGIETRLERLEQEMKSLKKEHRRGKETEQDLELELDSGETSALTLDLKHLMTLLKRPDNKGF